VFVRSVSFFRPFRLLLAAVLLSSPATGVRADGGRIVIGITPERNLFEQHERYTRLAEYLSKTTGLPIGVTILSRYGSVIDQFVDRHLEGAFFGSFAGALAHERLGAEALVRPVTASGKATYHAYMVVRREAGIRNVEDMRDKVMAFVDRNTSCGYVYPLAFLRRHGVRDPHAFFAESYFAGSHDAVIEALLDGLADVGVVKNTVFEEARAKDPAVDRLLRILDRSPAFPTHGLFVRTDLPPAVKNTIRKALISMSRSAEGKRVLAFMGISGFEPAESHDDYSAVFDLAEEAGIDLKTYRLTDR